MLYSKFIISILSFFSGAGIISFIDAHEARRQHQKDITVEEIRKFTRNLKIFNTLFTDRRNHFRKNKGDILTALIAIMCYISSWSVNVRFKRIDVKMLKYSSRTLLGREYKMLKTLTNACLDEGTKGHYYDVAVRVRKFFKYCGII